MMMTKTELRHEFHLCVAEAVASSNTHESWVHLDILGALGELLTEEQLLAIIEYINRTMSRPVQP